MRLTNKQLAALAGGAMFIVGLVAYWIWHPGKLPGKPYPVVTEDPLALCIKESRVLQEKYDSNDLADLSAIFSFVQHNAKFGNEDHVKRVYDAMSDETQRLAIQKCAEKHNADTPRIWLVNVMDEEKDPLDQVHVSTSAAFETCTTGENGKCPLLLSRSHGSWTIFARRKGFFTLQIDKDDKSLGQDMLTLRRQTTKVELRFRRANQLVKETLTVRVQSKDPFHKDGSRCDKQTWQQEDCQQTTTNDGMATFHFYGKRPQKVHIEAVIREHTESFEHEISDEQIVTFDLEVEGSTQVCRMKEGTSQPAPSACKGTTRPATQEETAAFMERNTCASRKVVVVSCN